MNIGIKTLSCIVVAFCIIQTIIFSDILSIANLYSYEVMTRYLMGFFTLIAAAIFFNFINLDRPSFLYLGIFRNKTLKRDELEILTFKGVTFSLSKRAVDDIYEWPSWAKKITILLSFFLVFCIAINDSTISLIESLPEKFKESDAAYCKRSDELDEDQVEKLGCKLVLRAYKMGYAKKLGDCGETAHKNNKGEEEVCKKRQYDEPLLHYTTRRVVSFASDHFKYLYPSQWAFQSKKLARQITSSKELLQNLLVAMNSKPRSAHHIYTNLSHPDGDSADSYRKNFVKNYCINNYSQMVHTLDPDSGEKQEARKFDYAYGHLLFNQTHSSSVGYCRDFVIHWNSPEDSCERLARSPRSFLEKTEAMESVQDVLHRIELIKEIKQVEADIAKMEKELEPDPVPEVKTLGEEEGNKEKIPEDDFIAAQKAEKAKKDEELKLSPQRVISFQCFMKDKVEEEAIEAEVTVDQIKFQALTIGHIPTIEQTHERIPVRYLKKLSKVLSPTFGYSELLSNQQTTNKVEAKSANEAEDAEQNDGLVEYFQTDEQLMLSKLELLTNADILLGHKWLHDRPDILAVYPWYLHLHHFVNMFRKDYSPKRGRL